MRRAPRRKICTVCGEEKSLTNFYAHPTGRLGTTSRCKPCSVKHAAAWALKNKERRKEIRLKWNANNKEQKRVSSEKLRARKKKENPKALAKQERDRAKAWRLKNPEKHAATLRACYLKRMKNDPIKERLRGHLAAIKRRKRAARSGGRGYTAEDVRRQLKRQKRRCWWCSARLGEKYHHDHFIPLCRGGLHDKSNIVMSCAKCNLKKGSKLPHQFCADKKRLKLYAPRVR
jgi:5-methylcytosine-specific restriction endonuclease McrA